MKKLLLHICIITFTMISSVPVFWAQDCEKQCSIYSAPEDVLLDYIRDTNIILSNIDAQIKQDKKISTAKANLDLTRLYNRYIFNWDWYFSSFDYHVALPLRSEIPDAVRRDYTLIQNTIKAQNNFLYKLALKWGTQTSISDPCGEIKNCQLSDTAWAAAAQVLANTKSLAEIYRKSFSSRWWAAINAPVLFGDNTASKIVKKYNYSVLIDCSKCKWEFGYRISEAIKNIGKNNSSWNDGIQKWKDWVALIQNEWKLLTWQRKQTDDEKAQEKRNLRNELNRQWLSSDSKQIILDNLEKSQNGSFINNNFLVNSINGIIESIDDGVDDFQAAVSTTRQWETNTISGFETTRTYVGRGSEINAIVSQLYTSLEPFAGPQNTASQSALARVTNIHTTLTKILNNSLNDETIKNAERACLNQHRNDSRAICNY